MSDPTDWLAWLEAEPRCEPFLSIAAQWKADKARLAEALERIKELEKERG